MIFKKSLNLHKLTIVYVTYNRKKLITNCIISLLKKKIPSYVEIIVIDDNSSDGTYKKIKNITKGTNIKVFKNKNNLGFSGNYIEAIRRAQGDYVVWASDKDGISFLGINLFLKWIENIKKGIDVAILNYSRSMFVKKNHITNIRKNKTRAIHYNELWHCSHGPGIAWRRNAVLQQLNKWNDFQKKYPTLSKYYPNLFLIIKLLPLGNCYFFNGSITCQVKYAKRSHFLEYEKSYNFLQSRWLQHKELIHFLKNCSRQAKYKKYYDLMIHSLNLNLHLFISTALREERPDLYSYWWRGFYSPLIVIKKIYKILKFVTYYLFIEPSWTIGRIKNRLNLIYKI
jgi:glycosyltransferase involved in cell wall biosynthesis